MNEPIRKYMKVGIIHFMAYPAVIKGEGPILETLKKIAVDDYFDVVEITWIKDVAVRKQARKLLETSNISIAYGAQPRLLVTGQNINDLDSSARKIAVENIKAGIDEAYEMNAIGCAFLSGKYVESSKDDAYKALLESTEELCVYAKSKGNMPIFHEIFDYDVDKKSLIGPAALAKKYAEDICCKHDNFKLMADLSHLPLCRETPKESLYPIKDYLGHIHIGNCVCKASNLPAYGDVHPRFGFPDSANGVDELVAFLKTLFEIGYLNGKTRPVVSFEVKPFGDEDPDLVIANAKRMLNLAWAIL